MRLFPALSRRRASIITVALSSALIVACEERLPTAIEEGGLPGEPITVEVKIPWSAFASALQVFGGYGSPEDLGRGVVANDFAGTLDARTLVRFAEYPTQVTARDSTGTARPDTNISFVGGRLVAYFDTIASTNAGPVTLGVGALQTEWDPRTASWDFSIDTINDQRPWPEPGGGPVTDLGNAVWDPATGDSVIFALDSIAVAGWADFANLASGVRIDLIDPGPRLEVRNLALRLDVRPSIAPDTLVEWTVGTQNVTFVYSPNPPPPPDGIRIGGAPAWRTILDLVIPEQLTGPAEFCAVVSCPHALKPGQISYAALVLTSRAADPAFQPSDSVRLDVRPVFDRSAMPKSPLGGSLVSEILGRGVAPEAFGSAPGAVIEIPFTQFARDLLRGEDEGGNLATNTLVLLSVFEPFSISFASFDGPGTAGEPYLRLVLTIGPSVQLP